MPSSEIRQGLFSAEAVSGETPKTTETTDSDNDHTRVDNTAIDKLDSSPDHSSQASDVADGDHGKNAQGADKYKGESKLSPEMKELVGENRRMPPCPGDHNDYILTWLGPNDPGKPTNWTLSKKVIVLALYAVANLTSVFGAASIGPGVQQIKREYHVGLPVATLNVSLYVLGFACGPMVWGPISELSGRKWPITIGALGLTIFAFACGSAANFQTLVLCRFFGGAIGACSLTIVPAITSDLFVTAQRGKAMSIVVLVIFAGPMLAPVMCGFIATSFLGWRWTQYIWGILSALSLMLCVFNKETYPPRLLAQRAKQIRHETGNWSISAPLENEELNARDILKKTILKPIIMLSVEPILLLISVYHGFIYGILYLCLQAVPLIFGDYGWHGGIVYLPYLGMLVGTIVSSAVSVIVFEPRFVKKLKASPYPVIPEERLPMMMVSGVLFSMGIFLMCWAGAYRAMWFVPTLGCSFIGFGLVGIFLTAFNYIIDSYLTLAASGMAANTFTRASFGAAFPLFAHPLFRNLGTQWAGTLLGCLGALLAPVPFFFYFYGAKIRSFSKYAAALETETNELSPGHMPISL